jgi:S-adenosylmethionine:tRNA ribosyltransferase-isomerase
VDRLLSDAGRMPLPPYIGRDPVRDERDDLDRERYQTTFAHPVDGPLTDHAAVAAPTAGLHLTPELLAAASERGVELGRVRLEVGEGTFRPIRVDDLADHRMHAETYAVSEELAGQLEAARSRNARVVAVGTTTVRALESAADEQGHIAPGRRSTELFIRPGYAFRVVDALVTNFHQPRSSLLVLVAAFAGRDTILAAYRDAIGRGFRLFSYGDAMFLHGRPEG